MQIRSESSRTNNTGSVLFITLVLAGLLGMALGSYLYWVRSQNLLTTESHAWNGALVVAEAGVEEALAQLNTKFGTNGNFAANNWGGPNAGIYGPVSRTIRNGTVTNGSYSAIITKDVATGFPIVYSTGYTTVPLVGRLITRVVKVETDTTPAFAGAMAALNNITFKGTQIAIDSYDSMDPAHSTSSPPGMYDPATRKAGGDVASISGVVSVGNANVNGKVKTGPNGTYNIGPTGFAGDLPWTGPGIQPGWYANDFNADFKDAALPDGFSFGLTPPPFGTNLYVLGGFDYTISGNLAMGAKETMIVTGNARLYVMGDVVMQGQSSIWIADGASLEIYVAGATAKFTEVNTKGNANSYKYFGLPTNTSLTWSGNSTYVGTVYAPQAAFECGGGGSTLYDYQGACVVKSVNLNGHFNFHYDENLKRRGPMSGFRMKSWTELRPG